MEEFLAIYVYLRIFLKIQSKLYKDKEMNDNKFMAMQCIKK